MKNYYSWIDTAFVKYAPQPLQHLAANDQASRLGGKIVFYNAEDFETLSTHSVIKKKIEQKPKIDGVIFFTLKQFFNNGKLNFQFLKFIIERGYEVHFSRERVQIMSKEVLDELFPILYATQYVSERDEPRHFWKPVLDLLDSSNFLL